MLFNPNQKVTATEMKATNQYRHIFRKKNGKQLQFFCNNNKLPIVSLQTTVNNIHGVGDNAHKKNLLNLNLQF